MTNYERIKAMSVEEMANLFFNWALSAPCPACFHIYDSPDCICGNCLFGVMMWLESEVDDVT